MTKCSKCEKVYGTYPVFLTGNSESLAMEFSIRDIYYDDEKKLGLCKKCREDVWKDKLGIWRLWLLARTKMIVLQNKYKEEGNEQKVREFDMAFKRIDKIERDLEKLPEVKKVLEENKKSMEEEDLLFWS